jgi:dienelactone hydrolase
MPKWFDNWMYDWETRLTLVDTNRVVRPLEWGMEWADSWPCRNGVAAGQMPADPEKYLSEYNRRIVAESDQFFSYRTPTDFRVEERPVQVFSTRAAPEPKLERKVQGQRGHFLRFTSPVRTPYPENDVVNARWFAAPGKRAVVVLPHWNANGIQYNALCAILQRFGIASLRLSLPYHDIRKPAEIQRSDYAVSANVCRTIDAARQGILDLRCCLDWLEQQGYTTLGTIGTSLGSCYSFLCAAHEPRIKVAAFNHASTFFADVVWTGQSTRHIKEGLAETITLDRLRDLWMSVSPAAYFDKYARYPRRSQIIFARYDLTFLPEFSREIVDEFHKRNLALESVELPCGHYTCGEPPFVYMDGWHLVKFVRKALAEAEG